MRKSIKSSFFLADPTIGFHKWWTRIYHYQREWFGCLCQPGYVLLTSPLLPINLKGQICVNDLLCNVACYSLTFMGVGIRLQTRPQSQGAVKCGTSVLPSHRHALVEVWDIWRWSNCADPGIETITSVWCFCNSTSTTAVF